MPTAMKAGRTVLGLAVAGLLAAGLGACSGSDGEGESASCVGQVFTVTPTSVPVGGSLTVHGRYYLDVCADVLDNGHPVATFSPLTGVPLTMSSTSGESRELAKLDATGNLGQIDSSVTLPKDVKPGTVTLRLGDADQVTVSVTS